MAPTEDMMVELLSLEQRLLALGPQCGRECADALLAPGFYEFGGSGRVLDREATLKDIADAPSRTFTIRDVQCVALCADAALLSYRLTIQARTSLRSSVWVQRNRGWQIVFHQGTRVP